MDCLRQLRRSGLTQNLMPLMDRIFDEGKEDVLQYFDLSNVEVFGEDEPTVKETKPNEGTT